MSVDVASHVLGCKTSQELWNAVKELSRTQTRSRVTLYKCELQCLRKGSLKVDEYLRKVKELAYNLTLAGSPLSNDDLITQMLTGLNVEYNTIVIQLAEKANLLWVELQSSLLTFKSILEQLSAVNQFSLPTANLVLNKQKSNSNSNQNKRG